MTNQEFCYWLQGYFEISQQITLTKKKVALISSKLRIIDEPLGLYTGWLFEVLSFFEAQQYHQPLMDYFLTEIKKRLNLIFLHVIDESYDHTLVSLEESRKIHYGE